MNEHDPRHDDPQSARPASPEPPPLPPEALGHDAQGAGEGVGARHVALGAALDAGLVDGVGGALGRGDDPARPGLGGELGLGEALG